MRQTATAEVRLDEGKAMSSSAARWATRRFGFEQRQLRSNFVAARLDETENRAQQPGNLGDVGLEEPAQGFETEQQATGHLVGSQGPDHVLIHCQNVAQAAIEGCLLIDCRAACRLVDELHYIDADANDVRI